MNNWHLHQLRGRVAKLEIEGVSINERGEPGGTPYRALTLFDENGRMIQWAGAAYEYDEAGNRTKPTRQFRSLEADGSWVEREELPPSPQGEGSGYGLRFLPLVYFFYHKARWAVTHWDAHGDARRLEFLTESGERETEIDLSVDAAGNVVRVEGRSSKFPASKTTLEYDERNRLMTLRSESTLGIVHTNRYEYNDRDLATVSITEQAGQPTVRATFEYEMDAQGNWESSMDSGDGPRVFLITKQMIEYYPARQNEPNLSTQRRGSIFPI